MFVAQAFGRLTFNSIRARLLLSSAVALLTFGALSGLLLERAFQSGLQQAQQDKMQTLVYSLLGAASTGSDGELVISLDAVPDPRLRQPLSGLEAALFDEDGQIVWSSTEYLRLSLVSAPEVGEWQFALLDDPNAFSLAFGLRWIDAADDPRRYTVVALDDALAYDRQLSVFRRTLWAWLGGVLIGLSLILLLLTSWGLSPLRRLGRELHAIESGWQQEIEGRYPDELEPLAHDLNTMIISERTQQTRYRNALGDLAHTLKTPLAVLRGLSEDLTLDSPEQRQLQEQVNRMQHIVDHQLQRAAAAGRRALTEPVAIEPLASKLMAALGKVYADKGIEYINAIPSELRLRADQGDLYELLGNLLDNASKYGRDMVRIQAETDSGHCAVTVEDAGDGFPEDAEALLRRGIRADTRVPGQGLGLAAVAEIVQSYGGRLLLGRSELGGAKITATFPARP